MPVVINGVRFSVASVLLNPQGIESADERLARNALWGGKMAELMNAEFRTAMREHGVELPDDPQP